MSATLGQPFAQVFEVWVPDRGKLRLHSAAYGRHREFAAASEGLLLRSGEGLPGTAWALGQPVLWTELDARFARREFAESAGLDAGVAVPMYRGDELVAVVAILCGGREQTGGCIELWEPNDLRELALSVGYYGRLRTFGEISRLLRFQRGRGLPGMVWELGVPVLIDELGESTSFVRAAAARASGVHTGLGIPLYKSRYLAHVLLLLSTHTTPLAREFELWTVSRKGELELSHRSALDRTIVGAAERPATLPGHALAQLVVAEQLPIASGNPQGLPRASGSPGYVQYELGLGLPVHDGERLRAVVVLLA